MYPSAGVSRKDGESEEGNRSQTLPLNVENEDHYEHLSLNESDGVSDYTSSIQLSTEGFNLGEFFDGGISVGMTTGVVGLPLVRF